MKEGAKFRRRSRRKRACSICLRPARKWHSAACPRRQGFPDRLAQAAGVKGFAKALPGLGGFWRQYASDQQPLEGDGDNGPLFAVGLARGAHEGQEKVVIHIQQAIEGVEGSDLSQGVVVSNLYR